VIDRLAANNIDLTKMPVEVAPIAHYHMGGVKADAAMATEVPGLFVAGEVVGGANGANRLSGNALTEAFVFGRRAGKSAAAKHVSRTASLKLRAVDTRAALDLVCAEAPNRNVPNAAAMIAKLQAIMADDLGPLRTAAKLARAAASIADLAAELGDLPPAGALFDLQRLEWFDLRNMLGVARAIAQSALNRTESRGAHQREDFPDMLPHWQRHQTAGWCDGEIKVSGGPAKALAS
jgi:succinate dehydrogenase / fumarate reductase, flavoprotein subunit